MIGTEYHLLQNLNNPPFKLSKMERKLQAYLLENISHIGHLSIVALEQDAGVGKSTISRFCRRMGVQNFREFSTVLAQETALNYSNIHITAQPGDDMCEIARKLYVLECETLRQTYSFFNYSAMKEVSERLLNSDVIHVFSCGGSCAVAMDFYHKMLRLGIRAVYQQDLIQQKMQAESVRNGEVAFVFTFSGEDHSMLEIVSALKNNAAFVVGITNGNHSRLAKMADVILSGVNREEFTYTGTIESRLSLMYVVDLLFILTSMRGTPITTDMLNRTKAVLDKTKKETSNTFDMKGNTNE